MHDLEHLIDQLPMAVWVGVVPTGEVVYTNPAFREIVGMEAVDSCRIADAAQTYGLFDLDGNSYPVERLPFSQVVRTHEPVVVDDLVIRGADGEHKNLRAFAHPIIPGGGELTHVCVTFIDITREVRAELERDTAAARLQMAVDHSPVVIWAADTNGTITLSQGAALASLGVTSGELVGRNIFDLYEEHPTISGFIRRGLGGESLQYVVEVGDAIFDTWLTPIRDATGNVLGVTGLSRDIRELRKLQAISIQRDRTRALGTLAASVAHEINNPLTYILARAQQVEAALEELAELPEFVGGAASERARSLLAGLREDSQVVKEGTERIAGITRELRTFSHFDDQVIAVDARAVVHSVLQLVGKELEARARISLDLRRTASVAGHPSRLVQVVLNLVTNAMQGLPPTRRDDHVIEIGTYTRDGQVFIEVADSGPGVPAAERERIFDPFVTTKGVGEGTGLGLFVCRNIVRGYSGEISVHDRAGGGAVFRVCIPVSHGVARAPASVRPRRATAPAKNAHILVIDDDPHVLAALLGTLKRAGYHTSGCSSAEDGLRRLAAHEDLDLVFCDLMMKGMTGMELHARLMQELPGALPKVVFMTGGAHSPSAAQFLLEHASDVLQKPFDLVWRGGAPAGLRHASRARSTHVMSARQRGMGCS